MQEQLDRIEAKVDKLSDQQASHNVTLAEQNIMLQEHMKRSESNERAVKILADEIKGPINTRIIKIETILRVIGWIIGLVAASGVAIHFLH
jgi:hypothetical protein